MYRYGKNDNHSDVVWCSILFWRALLALPHPCVLLRHGEIRLFCFEVDLVIPVIIWKTFSEKHFFGGSLGAGQGETKVAILKGFQQK